MSGKPSNESKHQAKAARRAQRVAARTPPPGWRNPLAQQQPLVSGRWLLRTVSGVIAVAAICAYLTLCLLFYQGQWQVVFHPTRTITATPAAAGLPFDEVHFDDTGTGQPQLNGWWIPAAPNAPYSDRTILLVHGAGGSLSDLLPQLKELHSLGVNLFAFDYRGFGRSADSHPSETRVYEDADAAWSYLTGIRHLDPRSIVLCGSGIGAVVAAETALRHPEVRALVLENPAPPALSLIEADARTSILPVRWLFHDRFEIAPRLRRLGIDLNQPGMDSVVNGQPAPSTTVLHPAAWSETGLALFFFLGPDPTTNPRYLSAWADLLKQTGTGH